MIRRVDGWNVRIPFLRDNPDFIQGVEVGLLYFTLFYLHPEVHSGVFRRANDEQIFMVARLCGYGYSWRVLDSDDTYIRVSFRLKSD